MKIVKILSVLILLYVFTVGMLIPLKPGIVAVTPSAVRTGEDVTLRVEGYNSHYEEGKENLRAWLKLDEEHALAAQAVEVQSNRNVSLQFSIPEYLPGRERVGNFSLILDNPVDGASVLPSALFVTQDSLDPELGKSAWEKQNATIEELHELDGMTFPFRNILSETIRNTYFHVPLWFAMLFIFIGGVYNSIGYLRKGQLLSDTAAASFTKVGILFGILGLLTGAIWAKNTWGSFWSWDVKQNMTAIALLIYFAYFVLRHSFEDQERKARISAVYNIFAFSALIPLIYVIPRLTDSLHPGSGGNPAMGGEDLDHTMRMVFYPAIIGWTLFGIWITDLVKRAEVLRLQLLERAWG